MRGGLYIPDMAKEKPQGEGGWRRWIMERAFVWLSFHLRLSKDYDSTLSIFGVGKS
jgi:hypothetical protein